MKKIISLIFIALLFGAGLQAEDNSGRVNASREAVKSFFTELKSALQQALATGGPTNAIQVCEEKAPQIAATLSDQKGWYIGRTSLKTRNHTNEPDDWERSVLEQFEARRAAGEDPQQLEFSAIVTINGQKRFRYMKAIPTQSLCLTCHGDNIAPEVIQKIDQLYPGDKARGFKEGDLRGAFTISQPM